MNKGTLVKHVLHVLTVLEHATSRSAVMPTMCTLHAAILRTERCSGQWFLCLKKREKIVKAYLVHDFITVTCISAWHGI